MYNTGFIKKNVHAKKNLIYRKLGIAVSIILSWIQILTNISQFPTKFLAVTFRLITINGMSL